MKLSDVICGVPISAGEQEEAKRRRELRIRQFLEEGPICLIRLTLNIIGPVKSFPMALDAFHEGVCAIRRELSSFSFERLDCSPGAIPDGSPAVKPGDHPGGEPGETSRDGAGFVFREFKENTGAEGYFLLFEKSGTAGLVKAVKKRMISIEENHPLGRLFNIDVFSPDGNPISRGLLGLGSRSCLVCGEPAASCIEKRAHSTELILWRTVQILNDFFRGKAADLAAACAVRALLYEVSATPKPGLVDRNNSGSHQDMDFFTFLDSSAALIPWFRDFFCIGWDHASDPEPLLFSRLRFAGKRAEEQMFSATGGVNTHKGLAFSFAVLCGALGQIHARRPLPLDGTQVIDACRKLGRCALDDFQKTGEKEPQGEPSETNGEQCRRRYGLLGARGEAAAGFPSALRYGLPVLKKRLAKGDPLNDAAVFSLLSLIASVDDTNMIHRGGFAAAQDRKKEAMRLLSQLTNENFHDALNALDSSYIRENLSPGGCADLLAVSLMLCFLEQSGLVDAFY